MCAKDDLTLGESKTTDDLTLEDKGADTTWANATGKWNAQTGTWELPRGSLTLESKTKDDLTLETK